MTASLAGMGSAVCAAASRASNAAPRGRGSGPRPRASTAAAARRRAPARSRIVTRFVSVPKPEPASLTSFATSRSTPFARELRRPPGRASRSPPRTRRGPGGGAAARPRRPCAATSASRSGVGVELEASGPRSRAILRSAGRGRREVGDRGGHDERVGAGGVGRRIASRARRAARRSSRRGRPRAASGSGTSTAAAISVTAAPRASAASARATPIFPVERLPM